MPFKKGDGLGKRLGNKTKVFKSRAEISTRNGFIIIVDPADVAMTRPHTWTTNASGYAVSRISGKLEYMHRHLFGSDAVDKTIDHKNGDKSDNRRQNLRFCTARQNNANQQNRAIKGYTFRREYKDRKYVAIGKLADGSTKYIGRFRSAEEAASAKRDHRIKEYGEFASDNWSQ